MPHTGPQASSRTTLSTRLKYARRPRRRHRQHLAALGAAELAASIREHKSTPSARASGSEPDVPTALHVQMIVCTDSGSPMRSRASGFAARAGSGSLVRMRPPETVTN